MVLSRALACSGLGETLRPRAVAPPAGTGFQDFAALAIPAGELADQLTTGLLVDAGAAVTGVLTVARPARKAPPRALAQSADCRKRDLRDIGLGEDRAGLDFIPALNQSTGRESIGLSNIRREPRKAGVRPAGGLKP